jgi:metallo-beta-lactamase family protein
MEQGRDSFENQELPISAASVDAVLLTHAHIDHSGKLPMLYNQGFRGEIHATGATGALCDIMLRDSAHIQMAEAEWRNRKGKRSGGKAYVPLYDMEDAMATVRMFVTHDYNERFVLFEGIEVRFIDVGHLLGSASIEIWITEAGVTKKIVFSGDIGNIDQPLINNPEYINEADYVVMESTYGDRNHEIPPDYVTELSKIIQETFGRGGNLVIPSFAIGRTQVLLYYIRKIKEDGLIKGHDNFKVYVDSPLAIEATHIYEKNIAGYFDKEAMELINAGINPIKFPGLKTAITSDESKAINYIDEPKVIISAAGMCDAGRIRHHLKHNLWREDSTILFVGHQSEGSLGRIILDGAPEVKLFGEVVTVNAHIRRLHGVSGHADRDGLIRWLTAIEKKPERVFVVHGDDKVCETFTEYIRDELGYNAYAPYSGTVVDLLRNVIVVEGQRIPVVRKEDKKKAATIYEKLVNAGKRLMIVIQHNKGGTNKDLAKFTSQINALCDKWDR